MKGIGYYGGSDVNLDRIDIRGMGCLSIDLRAQTGMNVPDETCVMPPGTFTLSVVGPLLPGEMPIGEIRFFYPPARRELSLVGHLTGRAGVTEVTPDHLLAMMQDNGYRASMLQWLGVAA